MQVNTSCSFGDAFQPDTNFSALTGPLPEIVCLIKLPVPTVALYITVWRWFGNISFMVTAIHLIQTDSGHGMVNLRWWNTCAWVDLIFYLLMLKQGANSRCSVNFVLRPSLKRAIWFTISYNNMENLQLKLKYFNMFCNRDMHPEVATACHLSGLSSKPISAWGFFNLVWCTTMGTSSFPCLFPMMPGPMIWWTITFQWSVSNWYMSVCNREIWHCFNGTQISCWRYVPAVYVVVRLSHSLDLPRNMCYDIICRRAMLSRGKSFKVGFRWWFIADNMIIYKHVIGMVWEFCALMLTLNMIIIWLNVQCSCILQRGFQFRSFLVPMEVQPEDVPMQMLEVLGNFALDYGAQNGHMLKEKAGSNIKTLFAKQRCQGGGSTQAYDVDDTASSSTRTRPDGAAVPGQLCPLPVDEQGGNVDTITSGECQLEKGPVTGPSDDASGRSEWQSWRIANKTIHCGPPTCNLLKDGSWPCLIWNSAKKCQELDGKAKRIPMAEMLNNLEQLSHMLKPQDQVIRFHSLQNQIKDVPVIPWKLELDMKNSTLHNQLNAMVCNTVWQLLSPPIKKQHLSQSKLADELMRLTKKSSKGRNFASDWWTLCWAMMMFSALWIRCFSRCGGLTCYVVISLWGLGVSWPVNNNWFFWLTIVIHCVYALTPSSGSCGAMEGFWEHMVNGTMVNFFAFSWGGWAPHWFSQMLGLSLLRKVKALHPCCCTQSFGWTSPTLLPFNPLLTGGRKWMEWLQPWPLRQNLCAFNSVHFNLCHRQIALHLVLETWWFTWRFLPMPNRVIALVSYLGDSWRRHYTCAISYTNSFGESRWLHHDDNKRPQVWHEIPEWYTWNITHVWLVRKDKHTWAGINFQVFTIPRKFELWPWNVRWPVCNDCNLVPLFGTVAFFLFRFMAMWHSQLFGLIACLRMQFIVFHGVTWILCNAELLARCFQRLPSFCMVWNLPLLMIPVVVTTDLVRGFGLITCGVIACPVLFAETAQWSAVAAQTFAKEISPRQPSWAYLGHILGCILKSLGQRFHRETFLEPILATSWASSWNL